MFVMAEIVEAGRENGEEEAAARVDRILTFWVAADTKRKATMTKLQIHNIFRIIDRRTLGRILCRLVL